MRQVRLRRKSPQSEWQAAYRRAVESPDRERARLLVEEAADRLSSRLLRSDNPVMAWSGGKDSIALQPVAELAGVSESFIVLADERLEVPEFEEFVRSSAAPQGLYNERRSEVNLEWLAQRPNLVMPQTSKDAATWYRSVQHTGQRNYAKRNSVDLMILGRRRADGNVVGRKKGEIEYVDRGGFTRYSPLTAWSHEDVLNVIAAYGLKLPSIYDHPRGFLVGTGPWAARTGTKSVAEGWREVAEIDLELVRLSAEHNLYGADEALKQLSP